MQLDHRDISEFREIYRRRFDVELTDEEAERKALEVVRFVQFLLELDRRDK